MKKQKQHSNARGEMLDINAEQLKYYEADYSVRGNLASRVWSRIRDRIETLRAELGVEQDILDAHRRWLGDLTGKRVLDLGCFDGNALSIPIAEQADSYLGIDLSPTAIDRLRDKLQAAGLTHADAQAVDFLSADFQGQFDVVYAHSVAHHFKHFDSFLESLDAHLAPNGKVVTFDPLQTSVAVRLARALYRPFQSDRDWEWPFKRSTFQQISDRFHINQVQGVMGRTKWALPISFVSRRTAGAIGRVLYAMDTRDATTVGPGLWRCMAVSMLWHKK
jgi:2-polyprenyl-3-methyl-5-hydroxy-6-metoxy-1,4-benzoquinol methylase